MNTKESRAVEFEHAKRWDDELLLTQLRLKRDEAAHRVAMIEARIASVRKPLTPFIVCNGATGPVTLELFNDCGESVARDFSRPEALRLASILFSAAKS